MSFLVEVIPQVCWIILYLQYLLVNEGGPELPCMTGVTNITIIITIINIIIIIFISFFAIY